MARSADLIIDAQVTPMDGTARRGYPVKTSRRVARELRVKAAEASDPMVRHGNLWSEWDVAGRCKSPIALQVAGLDVGPFHRRGIAPRWDIDGVPVDDAQKAVWRSAEYVDMTVRCRKCSACLRLRSALWSARARAEIASARRTWFGTLTLSAERQHHFLSLARAKAARNSSDFDAMSEADQFRRRLREIQRPITLFLKRVRKLSNARIRYVIVCERHVSGDPHFHVLLHELNGGDAVLYKHLAGRQDVKDYVPAPWREGFTNWQLVGDRDELDGKRAAYYVAKYLSKSALARVRASKRYGVTV